MKSTSISGINWTSSMLWVFKLALCGKGVEWLLYCSLPTEKRLLWEENILTLDISFEKIWETKRKKSV
jgi:hypothetical protein